MFVFNFLFYIISPDFRVAKLICPTKRGRWATSYGVGTRSAHGCRLDCYKLQSHLFIIRIMSHVSAPTPRRPPAGEEWCASSGISANSPTRQNYLSSLCERVHLERSEWDTVVRWHGSYLYSKAPERNGWRVFMSGGLQLTRVVCLKY